MPNSNDIKERIAEVLLELSLKFKSRGKLAEELDSNSTSIKQYMETKNTYPQVDFIYRLCVKANINPNWLILGQGAKMLNEKEQYSFQNAVGGNNSKITQIMHSNNILTHDNEALKRENDLLREMLDLYRNASKMPLN